MALFHKNYYTLARDSRELQPLIVYPFLYLDYTLARDSRELQHMAMLSQVMMNYTLARDSRELQLENCL